VRSALKGYLESGEYTVGNHKGIAWAGMILCGNIPKEIMDIFVDTDKDQPSIIRAHCLGNMRSSKSRKHYFPWLIVSANHRLQTAIILC
jgi:hypothetical protein